MSALLPKDGVIGRRCCGQLKILGAALQADGETRSVDAASSIRRRSAAWTILRDWTFRSRTRASVLWMARVESFGRLRLQASPMLCFGCSGIRPITLSGLANVRFWHEADIGGPRNRMR